MKIRNGFVSNSSSSSFMITMKNNKELTKKNIMEVLNVNEDSFFYNIAIEIADVFVQNIELSNIDDLFEYYGYLNKSDPTFKEKIEHLAEENSFLNKETLENINNNKIKYYIGNISNEDGGIESALCSMNIQYEDENIKIETGD